MDHYPRICALEYTGWVNTLIYMLAALLCGTFAIRSWMVDNPADAIWHTSGVFGQDNMQELTSLAPSYLELLGGPVTPGSNTW